MQRFSFIKNLFILVLLSSILTSCKDFDFLFSPKKQSSVDPAGNGDGTGGGTTPTPPVEKPASMVYLTSETMKVGFNMDYGGSITYMSPASSSSNIVNNYDLGRQLQYAYYSFPIETYKPNGVSPHPAWTNIGWDPIQTGDVYGNGSRVIERRQEGNKLYFKTIPMQWGYNNVPCECTVETYAELKGNALELRNVLQLNRTDSYPLLPRGQDIGGGYLTSKFYRFKGYWGDAPFTNSPLTEFSIPNAPYKRADGTIEMYLPESWGYLQSDDGIGLGLFVPQSHIFSSNFLGSPNTGNEFSFQSGILGGQMQGEILDKNLRYETRLTYILGTVDQVRQYAYQHKSEGIQPNFDFSTDRQHWIYYDELDDGGYPFKGEWFLKFDKKITSLWSPNVAWNASSISKMYLRIAYKGTETNLRFLWWVQPPTAAPYDHKDYSTEITLIPDGQYHTYEIDLSNNPNWKGNVRRLLIDLGSQPEAGKWIKIKSISSTAP